MKETIDLLINELSLKIIGGILVALLAGITAFLANKNIGVYNDAVRPLVGEKLKGNLKYRTLSTMSFSMSIGYVVGFIPFSITSKILIVHAVLLGSEIIGLMFNNKKRWEPILVVILAMGYGSALFWGLNGLGTVIDKISYKGFGFDLGLIGDGAFPFIFAMFPAIATFLQSGWKKGTITIFASILTYIIIATFGWNQAKLYPMAITLLVGTAMLFGFSIHQFRANQKTDATQKEAMLKGRFDVFKNNAAIIKKNKWYFVLSGAIAAMAVSTFSIAPLVSAKLHVDGQLYAALIADSTWVIGFFPLVVLTALLTGVYSPIGLTMVLGFGTIAKIIGVAIVEQTNNVNMYLIAVAIAGMLGGLSMLGEVYMLQGIAKLVVRVPGIQSLTDSMRTGITKTINVAFLFGGVIAAFIMGQHVASAIGTLGVAIGGLAFWLPSLSAGSILLFYLINKQTKHKIAELAIGPLGALCVGILLNVLYAIAMVV